MVVWLTPKVKQGVLTAVCRSPPARRRLRLPGNGPDRDRAARPEAKPDTREDPGPAAGSDRNTPERRAARDRGTIDRDRPRLDYGPPGLDATRAIGALRRRQALRRDPASGRGRAFGRIAAFDPGGGATVDVADGGVAEV